MRQVKKYSIDYLASTLQMCQGYKRKRKKKNCHRLKETKEL